MPSARLRRVTAGLAALGALTWLGLAPLVRALDPQLAVDLAWLPTPGADLIGHWEELRGVAPALPTDQTHDARDPWGLAWGSYWWETEWGQGGHAMTLAYSDGPNARDDHGGQDDLTVSRDLHHRQEVERFAASQVSTVSTRGSYRPPLLHWGLGLVDQLGGALALGLGCLLVAERLLLRLRRPGSPWHLVWLAPLPVTLGVWFVDRTCACAGFDWQAPLLVVPGRVAVDGGVGLGLLVAVALWQQQGLAGSGSEPWAT